MTRPSCMADSTDLSACDRSFTASRFAISHLFISVSQAAVASCSFISFTRMVIALYSCALSVAELHCFFRCCSIVLFVLRSSSSLRIFSDIIHAHTYNFLVFIKKSVLLKDLLLIQIFNKCIRVFLPTLHIIT